MKVNPKEYRKFVKSACEVCGFTNPDVPLEVHHRDGVRSNNNESNLQTLCPNCHKAVHKRSGGRGRPKGPKKVVWKRRVLPEMVEVLEGVLKAPRTGVDAFERVRVSDLKELKEAGEVVDAAWKTVAQEREGEVEKLRVESEGLRRELQSMGGVSVKALLEDVDAKSKEIEDLKGRLDRCSRATDDQKVKWWIMKYDQLKGSMVKGEFDQG